MWIDWIILMLFKFIFMSFMILLFYVCGAFTFCIFPPSSTHLDSEGVLHFPDFVECQLVVVHSIFFFGIDLSYNLISCNNSILAWWHYNFSDFHWIYYDSTFKNWIAPGMIHWVAINFGRLETASESRTVVACPYLKLNCWCGKNLS